MSMGDYSCTCAWNCRQSLLPGETDFASTVYFNSKDVARLQQVSIVMDCIWWVLVMFLFMGIFVELWMDGRDDESEAEGREGNGGQVACQAFGYGLLSARGEALVRRQHQRDSLCLRAEVCYCAKVAAMVEQKEGGRVPADAQPSGTTLPSQSTSFPHQQLDQSQSRCHKVGTSTMSELASQPP